MNIQKLMAYINKARSHRSEIPHISISQVFVDQGIGQDTGIITNICKKKKLAFITITGIIMIFIFLETTSYDI